ncbi:MAG: biopolymer transporter ExbD, partial [Phycisphaerae bacterium]|nr:biopolymer transporter ExbD [Phycisphaerae bacterium]
LDCDYNLEYRYTVEAITAISGRIVENAIVPLVEKVKFAPARPPG